MRFFIIVFFIYTNNLFSQSESLNSFLFREFKYENHTLPYRVLEPYTYTEKNVPLIIFLHGSGERGDDNELQLTHGASFFLEKMKKKKFNSYVIFPQCQVNNRWSSEKKDPWLSHDEKIKVSDISLYGKMVIELIEYLIKEKNIDWVYTHWAGDTHQDHINTLNATMAAARLVKNVLCYEQVPLPRITTTYPVANYYVDISTTIDTKIKGCEIHNHQISKFSQYGFDMMENVKSL